MFKNAKIYFYVLSNAVA